MGASSRGPGRGPKRAGEQALERCPDGLLTSKSARWHAGRQGIFIPLR